MCAQSPAPQPRPAPPRAPRPAFPSLDPSRHSKAAGCSCAAGPARNRRAGCRRAQPARSPRVPSAQVPRPRSGDRATGEPAFANPGECFECPLCPLHEMSARSSITAKLGPSLAAARPRPKSRPHCLPGLGGLWPWPATRKRKVPQWPRLNSAEGHVGRGCI
jgi:hypothetical protein